MGVKIEVALWLIVCVHQLIVWNVQFNDQNVWTVHTSFWAKRLPPSIPPVTLKYFGMVALLIAVLMATRWRVLIFLGLLLGVPFLAFPLYHFWFPYLFDCCSFWHLNNGTYRAEGKASTLKKSYALFTKEYGSSINLLPTLHDKNPIFVDITNIVLTVVVLLAFYFSLKALIWPQWDAHSSDEEEDEAQQTPLEVKKDQ